MNDRLPAVVGELVACPFCGSTDVEAYPSDRERNLWNVCCGNPGCVTRGDNDYLSEADAIAAWNRRATLSALTAEAGKGEVTDAMVEAGCLAVVTVSGFKPENWPHTYPDAGQLRKAVRAALEAALSTATPAGEWVLVPRELTPEMYEAGFRQQYGISAPEIPNGYFDIFNAWYKAMLAASPRGAVESGRG